MTIAITGSCARVVSIVVELCSLGSRVGRGAGVLGAWGAKKRRPLLGRGALQNFGGAEIQTQYCTCRCRIYILKCFWMCITPLHI